MSAGEIVGLTLVVASLAGVAGVAACAIFAARWDRRVQVRLRRVDAHARWLAARMTLTRNSASFIAAFRALAAEDRHSQYVPLRREEAQRVRVAWCDAMRELDRAEAGLVVWSDDPAIRDRLAGFASVSPQALRSAINGSQGDVEQIIQRLHNADEVAADFVRAATTEKSPRAFPGKAPFTRAVAYAQAIVNHWSKAPKAGNR